ncbi:MAG: RNA polymerase sigma factor, partial [Blastocatellia bacterium]
RRMAPGRMAPVVNGLSPSNNVNVGPPGIVWGDVAEAEQTIAEPFRREDDEVVQRVLGGDPDAFEQLVRRYSPRVFSIISSFFHQRDRVEDIAQEAFVKAYTSLASYTLGRSFEAWIARIAVNCCYDQLRTMRKRGEQVAPQSDESEGDWLDLQMVEASIARHSSSERQREAADIASRLLAKLTPEDRLVLVLMDRDGFSVRDVADMTGWGPSKVKVRAFRARRTLRAAMKRQLTATERKRRSAKND